MSSPNGSKDGADWTTEETEDATSTHEDVSTLSPSARTAQTIPSAVTAVTCSLPPTPRTAPSISTGSTARRISSGSTASAIPTSLHDWSVNGSIMDSRDESEYGSKMKKEESKTDEGPADEHELPAPEILQKGAVVTEPNESAPATSVSAQKMSESSNESEQLTPTRYSSSVASSCPVILSSSPPVPSSPDIVERKEAESSDDGHGLQHETPILDGTIVTEEETTAQLQGFDPAVVAEQKEAGNVEKGIEETHPPDEDIVKEDKKKAMRIKYLDFDDSFGDDAGSTCGRGEERAQDQTTGDQPIDVEDHDSTDLLSNAYKSSLPAQSGATPSRLRASGETTEEVVVCKDCGLPIMKEPQCNLLECTCRATMCYICHDVAIDRTHFCNHGDDCLLGCCQLYNTQEEDLLEKEEPPKKRQRLESIKDTRYEPSTKHSSWRMSDSSVSSVGQAIGNRLDIPVAGMDSFQDMNLDNDSSLNDGSEMNTSMGAPLSSRRSSPRESPVRQQSPQSLDSSLDVRTELMLDATPPTSPASLRLSGGEDDKATETGASETGSESDDDLPKKKKAKRSKSKKGTKAKETGEEDADDDEEKARKEEDEKTRKADDEALESFEELVDQKLRNVDVIAKTFTVEKLLALQPRGDLLHKVDKVKMEKFAKVIKGKDIIKKGRLLSSEWYFIIKESEKNYDIPPSTIVVKGSSRLRCLASFPLQQDMMSMPLMAMASVVDDELHDVLWKVADEIGPDALDEAAKKTPTEGSLLLCSLFTSISKKNPSTPLSLIEKFQIVSNAVSEVISTKEREELPDRQIYPWSTAFVCRGIVSKQLQWAVQLLFALPLSVKAAVRYIQESGKFPLNSHLPVYIAKCSRIDDTKTSTLLSQSLGNISGIEIYEKLKSEIYGVVDTRGGGLSRTKTMDRLLTYAEIRCEADIPPRSLLLLMEEENDELSLTEWFKIYNHLDALIILAAKKPLAFREFSMMINRLSLLTVHPNYRIGLLRVKGEPREIAIFTEDLTFLSNAGYNEKLEEHLSNEMEKRPGGRILRPKGAPPMND